MLNNLKIETGSLIIRPFKVSDAKDASYYSRQPIVAHWLSDMVMKDEEEAVNWIKWVNGNLSIESTEIVLAIELKNEGKVIGVVGVHPKDTLDNEVEILYGVSDEYQRKGYCMEAASSLIQWVFENTATTRLSAIVKPENIASEKVIKKLGFIYKDTRMLEYDGRICKFNYYNKEKR